MVASNHQEKDKLASPGQTGDNLSKINKKTVIDYNPCNKVKINASMLMIAQLHN